MFLNDGPRPVAAATRARVLAAVAELGYRPNGVARSLRTKRTRVLALSCRTLPTHSSPNVARGGVGGIRPRFHPAGRNTMDDPARSKLYAQSFLNARSTA